MTHAELQAQEFVVLPLRLETIAVAGGPVNQQSALNQYNFNNMIGGDCIKANCSQASFQINSAYVTQSAVSRTTLSDVIEDSRQLAQQFFLGPAGGL